MNSNTMRSSKSSRSKNTTSSNDNTSSSFVASLPSRHRKRRQSTLFSSRSQKKRQDNKSNNNNNNNNDNDDDRTNYKKSENNNTSMIDPIPSPIVSSAILYDKKNIIHTENEETSRLSPASDKSALKSKRQYSHQERNNNAEQSVNNTNVSNVKIKQEKDDTSRHKYLQFNDNDLDEQSQQLLSNILRDSNEYKNRVNPNHVIKNSKEQSPQTKQNDENINDKNNNNSLLNDFVSHVQSLQNENKSLKLQLESVPTQQALLEKENECRSLQRQVCKLQNEMKEKELSIVNLRNEIDAHRQRSNDYNVKVMSWLKNVGFHFGYDDINDGQPKRAFLTRTVEWEVPPPPFASDIAVHSDETIDDIGETEKDQRMRNRGASSASTTSPNIEGAIQIQKETSKMVVDANPTLEKNYNKNLIVDQGKHCFSIKKVNNNNPTKSVDVGLQSKKNGIDKSQEQNFVFSVGIIGDEDSSSATDDDTDTQLLEQTNMSTVYDVSSAFHKKSPVSVPTKDNNLAYVTPSTLKSGSNIDNSTINRSGGNRSMSSYHSGSSSSTTDKIQAQIDTPKHIPICDVSNKLNVQDRFHQNQNICQPVNDGFYHRNKPDAVSKQSNVNEASKQKQQKKTTFRYQEVVRGKKAREALKGFSCEHCDEFIKAVCNHPGGDVFDPKMFTSCSRHRAEHSPPKTPVDFWELDFIDERKAKLDAEKKQLRTDTDSQNLDDV